MIRYFNKFFQSTRQRRGILKLSSLRQQQSVLSSQERCLTFCGLCNIHVFSVFKCEFQVVLFLSCSMKGHRMVLCGDDINDILYAGASAIRCCLQHQHTMWMAI